MSIDSSDESIEFKVKPRPSSTRPKGYAGLVVVVLLGIAVALLIIIATLQQKRLIEESAQISRLQQQIETLESQAIDLQKSVDVCKGSKSPK